MVVADELAVWLYGTWVATIDSERRRPRLTYTDEARRMYSPGTPLLSLSLPVRTERFPQGIVRPFLDGLLPEGESRRVIARDVGVDADDTYGLVAYDPTIGDAGDWKQLTPVKNVGNA